MTSNREFAATDTIFQAACAAAVYTNQKEVKPTKRQASKWRRGFGIAFTTAQEEV